MKDRRLIVYIIDDDEAMRDSLQQLLDSRGFRAETYSQASDFLDQFNQQMAGCILADIHMPGLSGLELQSRLNELGSSIPIVVMTGNADVPSAIRAMKHGALDFIEKPIETESLLSAVGTGLAKREAELNSKNSTSNASARIAELTPRERDVLTRLIGGQPNKIIAHELGISPRTVENHRAHLMLKMNVNSIAELVHLAMAAGVTAASAVKT